MGRLHEDDVVAGDRAEQPDVPLTVREAAEELGLTYREFLDRLAARGIPVESGPLDTKALEEARQKSGSGV